MQRKLEQAVSIILFGSMWGLLEASVGGALHMFRWPFIGEAMTAFGCGVMMLALRGGVSHAGVAFVAVVAASFKFTDAFLFSIPLNDIHIINPAQAILMEGLAFAFVSHLFKKPFVTAAFVIPLSIVLFNLVSYFVVGFRITGYLENPARTLFVAMPLGIFLTTIVLKITGRFKIYNLSLQWRIAASVCIASLAIFIRAIIY